MKRYLKLENFISFFIGSAFLCCLSTIQKIAVGYPILLKSYIVPFFLGGIFAFFGAEWLSRTKEKQFKVVESEKSYRYLFDSAPDAIEILDNNGTILDCNNTELSLTGYSRQELIGRNFTDILTEKSSGMFKEKFQDVKLLQKCEGRLEVICKDGNKVDIWRKGVPLVDSAGKLKGVLGFNRDIKEQKKLEEELVQARKMEAIGTLAGGIAHDFNNILSVILGNADMAKLDAQSGSPAEEEIDQIIEAGIRATDLVKQILTFSRKTEHQLHPFRPHLLIKEALKLLRSSLPTTIEIKQNIDSECGLILADPTQIHQIMLNLCTNAVHAMENEKGILTISLCRKEVRPEEFPDQSDTEAGPFIVLSISDTGHGMNEATKQRIFDPYFTTKKQDEGTGLGLAVVHGIIMDYKGFIRVQSSPEKGSAFHLYFPAMEMDTADQEQTLDEHSLPSGNERIMLVDDDSALVEINKSILERLGYTVIGATDSWNALEEFRANPDRFDLIITDMTMPYLTGFELAQAVLQVKPTMPVILSTGYSSVISEEKALGIGIKKYVIKPVRRKELAEMVRMVLDEN